MKTRLPVFLIGLLVLASVPLYAQGRILPHEFPHHRPIDSPLELRQLHTEISIENQLAVTKVEHHFYNPGRTWKEGRFFYALPKGAQIREFKMRINGKLTKAELLDSGPAKKIYEDIVRSMRDPALLEAMGSGLIQARVFPIEAQSEKVITLEYQELLQTEDGLTSYSLPMTSDSNSQTQTNVNLSITLRSPSPLKTIWSPSHALEVQKENPHFAKASFESKNRQALRDFELFFSQSKTPIGLDVMTHSDRHGNYFLFNLTPPWPSGKTDTPIDLILILDTSGSMAGDKIQQAKTALTQCLGQLDQNDRFAIIRFSTGAEAFANEWRSGDRESKTEARTFVDTFEALGGTNIQAAFEMAAQYPSSASRPQVTLFLTDGKPTIGVRDNDALLKTIAKNSNRVFPVGIGTEVNTHLLDRMAERTRGRRTYVRSDEDLEFKISRLFSKIQAPLFTDLQLKVQGIRIQQTTPQELPDLYHGSSLLVMGTYTGQGRGTIQLSGMLDGKRQTFEFNHRFQKSRNEHDFIPQLWARRRVGFLLDQIRLHGESEELKQEVVLLAKRYGLLTPYTSYLILEDEKDLSMAGVQSPVREMVAPATEEEHRQLGQTRNDFKKESGSESIRTSRSIHEMTIADAIVAKPKLGEAPEPSVGPGPEAIEVRLGRAFYLRNGIWTDSDWLDKPNRNTIDIEYGSKAYFQLLKDNPELAPILSLGQNLRIRFKDKNYRISSS